MSQKLPVKSFERIKDTFIKTHNKESNKISFLEVDVQYFENDLPFLLEKIQIEKVEKLVTN